MNEHNQESLAVRMAETAMRRYIVDPPSWNYESGLLLSALLALGSETREPRFFRFVKETMEALIKADGTIKGYRLEDYNEDQINAGKVLFDLYAESSDPRYRVALQTLRSQFLTHPRTPSGCFWHKKIYPHQVWLDGLYMQGPFLARYARDFSEPGLFDEVIKEMTLVEAKTRDERTGLLYHGWDESRVQAWADPRTGCSPHFWGRGLGWYTMALVDVLDYLPPSHAGKTALAAIGRRLAAAIAPVQDPETGLWYQVLDKGERPGNYLESSASSMFVYFLAKGARIGLLPADSSLKAARRGFQGLVRVQVRLGPDGEAHLDGVCRVAGLGGNPYRDGSFAYYVSEPVVRDDDKGVGSFILASLEIEHRLKAAKRRAS